MLHGFPDHPGSNDPGKAEATTLRGGVVAFRGHAFVSFFAKSCRSFPGGRGKRRLLRAQSFAYVGCVPRGAYESRSRSRFHDFESCHFL
eukprot:10272608-Lingulodinium_polyedra.AAC.1